jgi:Glyoxalase-like domain
VVRRFGLGIDCADPASLARFWAEALGYPPPRVREGEDAAAVLEPPEPGLPDVYFQRVTSRTTDPALVRRVACHAAVAQLQPDVDPQLRHL